MTAVVSSADHKSVRNRLLKWWRDHGRKFPWRHTSNPYRILIAEILLRRTRAEQVVPVYLKLIKRYPNPKRLSRSHPRVIYSLLRPLGLRWRAGDLVDLSRRFRSKVVILSGKSHSLESLPGVGDYVRAAVECQALGMSVPMIDANTARIASRYWGIEGGELRRNRHIISNLAELTRTHRAREVNLALIDLGAMICKPQVPRCSECPLNETCRKHGVSSCA